MLKQVIEEILKEEKIARDRVSAARDEAKKIRLDAENEAKKLETETREKAMKDARDILIKAEQDAEKEKQIILKTASVDMESVWSSKKELINQNVNRLFQIIFKRD